MALLWRISPVPSCRLVDAVCLTHVALVAELCFLNGLQMGMLGEKLLKELPDEARVIACRFPFPNWPQKSSAGSGLNQTFAYDISSVRSHLRNAPSR